MGGGGITQITKRADDNLNHGNLDNRGYQLYFRVMVILR